MALETLKGIKTIGGFAVHEDSKDASGPWEEGGPFVAVHHGDNTLAFKLQNGPIKEHGVNGCQVDTIISAALLIVKGLNANFPSSYNKECIHGLETAIDALERRTKDREARGVEGQNKA